MQPLSNSETRKSFAARVRLRYALLVGLIVSIPAHPQSSIMLHDFSSSRSRATIIAEASSEPKTDPKAKPQQKQKLPPAAQSKQQPAKEPQPSAQSHGSPPGQQPRHVPRSH